MSSLQKRQKTEVGDEKVRFIPICKQVSPFTSVVEQRTKEWFHMRRKRLTGSATSSLLFFKSEEERQLEYSRIFEDGPPKEFDDLAKERMQWGVDHEMCGVYTLLHHFPNYEVHEAGLKTSESVDFLGASPDGVVVNTVTGEHYALEIKCPSKKKNSRCTVPYKDIPYYYVFQLYMEMFCLGMRQCVFVSWGEKQTKIWRVGFEDEVWRLMLIFFTQFKDNTLQWEDFQEEQRKMKFFILPKVVKKYSTPVIVDSIHA